MILLIRLGRRASSTGQAASVGHNRDSGSREDSTQKYKIHPKSGKVLVRYTPVDTYNIP